MMRFFRSKSVQKKIFWGLVLLILPSFLLWGVALDQKGRRVSDMAGKIDSKKITTGQFMNQCTALERQISLFMNRRDRNLKPQFNLEAMTWDRILLLDWAKKHKIRVPNEEVVAWLTRQDMFVSSGRFDPMQYQYFVENHLRISQRNFEEEIRDMLMVQKAIEQLMTPQKVDETEIKKFFTANFAPRDLKYVLIARPEDKTAQPVTVTEEELKAVYQAAPTAFVEPETVKARYAFIPKGSAQDAPEARKAVREGGTDKAASFSDFKTGETGLLKRQDVLPEIGYSDKATEALFALNYAGDKTAWISSDKGDILFELVSKQPRKLLSYEAAKPELERIMIDHKKDTALFDKAVEIQKAMLANGFEKTAEADKLEVLEAKNFAGGNYLDKVGVISFRGSHLSALKPGEISSPMKTPNGFALIKIERINEEFKEGWEEKKAALTEELKMRKTMGAYEEKMLELRSHLKVNQATMDLIFPQNHQTPDRSINTDSSVPIDLSGDF